MIEVTTCVKGGTGAEIQEAGAFQIEINRFGGMVTSSADGALDLVPGGGMEGLAGVPALPMGGVPLEFDVFFGIPAFEQQPDRLLDKSFHRGSRAGGAPFRAPRSPGLL